MNIVTRFAPSPTGFLHIGSARTALFNYLFAKRYGGKFYLRIEDTDRERSTKEAVEAIFESMKWLQLDWDGEVVFQSHCFERHQAMAYQLLAEGKAYACYCTQEELSQMREEAMAKGLSPKYNGLWRDRPPEEAPPGRSPVIRFKAPQEGETIIEDLVQGKVRLVNTQLDDRVLLRADGTPTYMLSVVVDDHDMDITHIIRGDDHLTNTFIQYHLHKALGWEAPSFAHIPLIHGPDGAKLSKRHGALGAENYRDMGFLPEAMCNYLLRLGWAHGDEEIINRTQAISWFDLKGVGRSPARFDMAKLTNLNGHYIRAADNIRLLDLILPFMESSLQRALTSLEQERVFRGMEGLKQRAKTLLELADNALFYVEAQPYDEKALTSLGEAGVERAKFLLENLEKVEDFQEKTLEVYCRQWAEERQDKLGNLAQSLRVALCGKTVSPSVFEMMRILGKQETCQRLSRFLHSIPPEA